MNTRRDFIKYVATAGAAVAFHVDARAKKQPGESVLYTRRVRERTRTLSVASGRWQWIVGHHSAIKYGNAAIYDRAHRERGMENGLAYHFVIGNGIDSGDGEIEIGPRWLKQLKGGHVHREDVNEVGIGICLVGNFEETKPTPISWRPFESWLITCDPTSSERRFDLRCIEKLIRAGLFAPGVISRSPKCTDSMDDLYLRTPSIKAKIREWRREVC